MTGPEKGELHVIGGGRVRFAKPVDVARINNVNTADEIGAGLFEFTDSFRVGGFLKSHFVTLLAAVTGKTSFCVTRCAGMEMTCQFFAARVS